MGNCYIGIHAEDLFSLVDGTHSLERGAREGYDTIHTTAGYGISRFPAVDSINTTEWGKWPPPTHTAEQWGGNVKACESKPITFWWECSSGRHSSTNHPIQHSKTTSYSIFSFIETHFYIWAQSCTKDLLMLHCKKVTPPPCKLVWLCYIISIWYPTEFRNGEMWLDSYLKLQ